MRLRRRRSKAGADKVIDLRERLAPYVDVELDARPLVDGDRPTDSVLTGPAPRPLPAEPYRPRHLAP